MEAHTYSRYWSGTSLQWRLFLIKMMSSITFWALTRSVFIEFLVASMRVKNFPSLLFCSLVSQHPRQARQIKAKEAEIIGLWNGLKVRYNAFSIISYEQQ